MKPPILRTLILLSTFPLFYFYIYTLNLELYVRAMKLADNFNVTTYVEGPIFENKGETNAIDIAIVSKSKAHFDGGTNEDEIKSIISDKIYHKIQDTKHKIIEPETAELAKVQSGTNRTLPLDFERRHWCTWSSKPRCKNYVVRFTLANSRPFCALASFPGSGNTWFRYLIEASSGAFTSSVYDDAQLYLWGYLGEIEPVTAGTTIIQKSHLASLATVKEFNRTAVLIIRNPYRAIISYHNFMFGGHKAYAPIVNYRRKDWHAFVHVQLRRWLELIMLWVKEGRRILIIQYENLQEDPMREIRRALDFLEMPIDEGRLSCVKEDLGKSLKRNKEVFPSNLEIFSNITRDKMDRGIRFISYLIQKHGHQAIPLHLYEFYNGSSSSKIEILQCRPNETAFECDDRVDVLNLETRVLDFHNIEKSSTEKTTTLSYLESSSTPAQEISNKKLNESRSENLKQRQPAQNKVRKPFKFEKSTLHKIETSLLRFGTKLLAFVTENPITNLLKGEEINSKFDIPLVP